MSYEIVYYCPQCDSTQVEVREKYPPAPKRVSIDQWAELEPEPYAPAIAHFRLVAHRMTCLECGYFREVMRRE
jgi:hypothetical protein